MGELRTVLKEDSSERRIEAARQEVDDGLKHVLAGLETMSIVIEGGGYDPSAYRPVQQMIRLATDIHGQMQRLELWKMNEDYREYPSPDAGGPADLGDWVKTYPEDEGRMPREKPDPDEYLTEDDWDELAAQSGYEPLKKSDWDVEMSPGGYDEEADEEYPAEIIATHRQSGDSYYFDGNGGWWDANVSYGDVGWKEDFHSDI